MQRKMELGMQAAQAELDRERAQITAGNRRPGGGCRVLTAMADGR